NRHAGIFSSALDNDFRDTGGFERFGNVFTQLEILHQLVRIFAVVEPAGIPSAVDTNAHADRIDFLTHELGSYSLSSALSAFLAGVFLAAAFFAGALAVSFFGASAALAAGFAFAGAAFFTRCASESRSRTITVRREKGF